MLISGHKYESVWANIGSYKIWKSNDQKHLGTNIERNLKFNHYILKQCKKNRQKTKCTNQNLKQKTKCTNQNLNQKTKCTNQNLKQKTKCTNQNLQIHEP